MEKKFAKDMPVYRHDAAYAREHDELPQYRESYQANIACKEAMHLNKGKSIKQCLSERIDYGKNPDKTENGTFISSYACEQETADIDFALSKSPQQAETENPPSGGIFCFVAFLIKKALLAKEALNYEFSPQNAS